MKFQLAKHVSFTEVDDEAVILDLNSGAYFGLNHIGTQLIIELQQGRSPEQASKNIAEQYQMPNTTVDSDLQELLSQLIEQALIEPV